MKNLVWRVFQCMEIVGWKNYIFFFCWTFVYNLLVTLTCATNKCV